MRRTTPIRFATRRSTVAGAWLLGIFVAMIIIALVERM